MVATWVRGSVYRPDGIPLSGAEVWIVVPKALVLTRTGEDGSYELPCERSGRHLVEAGRTTDYAPERVPLVLRVKARSGFLPRPLQFSYEGKKVDLGTIALVPYPALRVRMRLPDGSWAESVVACRREDLRAAPDGFHPGGQLADESSWVTVEEERDVAMRLVLGAYPSPTEEVDEGRDGPPVLVEREVALRVGRPQELEVVVRPGPLAVAGRLVDGRWTRRRCVVLPPKALPLRQTWLITWSRRACRSAMPTKPWRVPYGHAERKG